MNTKYPFFARVEECRELDADLRLVRLGLSSPLPFFAGQHVAIHFPEPKLTAYYSLASAPSEGEGSLVVLVGRARSGPEVPFKEGIEVLISAAGGPDLLGSIEPRRELCLIGMGTGAAPLRSLALESLARFPERRVVLLVGGRSRARLAFHEEFEERACLSNFDYRPVFSREVPAGERPGRVQGHVAELLPSSGFFVICGSVPMVTSTRVLLQASGVAATSIHGEGYGDD